MSLRRMGFSTISPVAKTSPVVSTAVISMTTIMEMMAATPNVGSPKWKGVVTPTSPASPTPLQSTRPNSAAMTVPMTRPRSTATVLMKPPRKKR
jgi:hypothetical protein